MRFDGRGSAVKRLASVTLLSNPVIDISALEEVILVMQAGEVVKDVAP